MVELRELAKNRDEFAKRHVRVVVISNDDQQTARVTQSDFPSLVVVSDAEQIMAKAIEVIDAGVGPHLSDTNAPTTFLVDGTGNVRWFFRPDRFMNRLSADELLSAVDATWKKE